LGPEVIVSQVPLVDEVSWKMSKPFRAIAIIGFLAASFSITYAEDPRKLPKIGEIFNTPASVYKPYDEALRDGLRNLGYVEGKNIIFLPRSTDGDSTRLPALAKELITSDVDVLVVSIAAVQASMQATRTTPIVAPSMADPVRDGLVASFSHPGGNLTGGSGLGPDADAKRLQFAAELLPGLKRLGLLFEATNAQYTNGAEGMRLLADRFGLSLHTYGVTNLNEIRSAFGRIEKDRIQALIVWPTPLMLTHRESILKLSSRKLPVIGEGPEFVHAGALVTYSADYIEMWRHAAVHVDKILKGAKPGDLPIERPTKFVLRVNLKTAKELGITIPESSMVQAAEVIR
jgi:putative ABC transport system substrate-binding protein